jgi:hypothetical protein
MAQVDRPLDTRLVATPADRARSCVTRHIAGETIIVPVCDRVADLDAIYTLNELGTRIWALIDGPTPIDRIVRRITEEYTVSADQAAEDVTEFLSELQAAGLVRLTGTPGEG